LALSVMVSPALVVEADAAGSLKASRVNIDLAHHPLFDFFWAARSKPAQPG
jgi:hypothetical protein